MFEKLVSILLTKWKVSVLVKMIKGGLGDLGTLTKKNTAVEDYKRSSFGFLFYSWKIQSNFGINASQCVCNNFMNSKLILMKKCGIQMVWFHTNTFKSHPNLYLSCKANNRNCYRYLCMRTWSLPSEILEILIFFKWATTPVSYMAFWLHSAIT